MLQLALLGLKRRGSVRTKRVTDIRKQNGLLVGKPGKEISLQRLMKNGRIHTK
jgi:hypothetical protein